mmetsp:Transcript_14393/g.21185  ORF Transcript_14393/g.21185 Transcript_14393/m.21185 type:complete len:127 (+) Transcript_14393:1062-1442(+)
MHQISANGLIWMCCGALLAAPPVLHCPLRPRRGKTGGQPYATLRSRAIICCVFLLFMWSAGPPGAWTYQDQLVPPPPWGGRRVSSSLDIYCLTSYNICRLDGSPQCRASHGTSLEKIGRMNDSKDW